MLPQNRVKQTQLKNGELDTLYNNTQKALGAVLPMLFEYIVLLVYSHVCHEPVAVGASD